MTQPPAAGAWLPALDADAVLCAQGADPVRLRARSPRLASLAERAALDGAALLEARVACGRFGVRARGPCHVALEGGGRLTGPLVALRLGRSTDVVIAVVSVGSRLEARVSRMFGRDLPYALALDALGSAAVDALAVRVRRRVRALARRAGEDVTFPVSPGLEGWPLAQGQREIFDLLGHEPAGVTLHDTGRMTPRKSLSMVFGLGAAAREEGSACDPCAARETCRYRGRHERRG